MAEYEPYLQYDSTPFDPTIPYWQDPGLMSESGGGGYVNTPTSVNLPPINQGSLPPGSPYSFTPNIYRDNPVSAPQPSGSIPLPSYLFRSPEATLGNEVAPGGPPVFNKQAAIEFAKSYNPWLTGFMAPEGMQGLVPPEFLSGEDPELKRALLTARLRALGLPEGQIFNNMIPNPNKDISLNTGMYWDLPNQQMFNNLPLNTPNQELARIARQSVAGGRIAGEPPSALEKALWGLNLGLFSVGTGLAGGAFGAATGPSLGVSAGLGGGIAGGAVAGATPGALSDDPRGAAIGGVLGGIAGGAGALGGPLAGAGAGALSGGAKSLATGGDAKDAFLAAGLGAVPGLIGAGIGQFTPKGSMIPKIGSTVGSIGTGILRDRFRDNTMPQPPPIPTVGAAPGPPRRVAPNLPPTPSRPPLPAPMPLFTQVGGQMRGLRDEEYRRAGQAPVAPTTPTGPVYQDKPGLTQAGIAQGLAIGRLTPLRAQQLLNMIRVA